MDQGGTTVTTGPTGPRRTSTVSVQRTIAVAKPIDVVFSYLSDFTTTTECQLQLHRPHPASRADAQARPRAPC